MNRRLQVAWGTAPLACAFFLSAAVANAQPSRPGGAGERRAHGGMPGIEQILKRFDANSDGKLTEDELPERMAERMMRVDANGDGAVTKEEFEEVLKRFAGHRRGGDDGLTPLLRAVWKEGANRYNLVRQLVVAGMDVNERFLEPFGDCEPDATALHMAACKGDNRMRGLLVS